MVPMNPPDQLKADVHGRSRGKLYLNQRTHIRIATTVGYLQGSKSTLAAQHSRKVYAAQFNQELLRGKSNDVHPMAARANTSTARLLSRSNRHFNSAQG